MTAISRSRWILFTVLVIAAGCATASQTASPTPTPSPTADVTASPTPAATPSGSTGSSVVVTLQVREEEYRIELTDPADIDIALAHLAGEEAPGIPNGRIVYGDPGVNEGYSWHIDPNDIEWADLTTEVCDGLPSDVEDHHISGDRYCPWSAQVIAVDPTD